MATPREPRSSPRAIFLRVFICLLLGSLLLPGAILASPRPRRLAGYQASHLALLDPQIRIDPASSNVVLSDVFTVDVAIDAAVDLGGFEFVLHFDPTILQAQGATLGPFLGSTGRSPAALGPTINNVAGTVRFGGWSFGTLGTGPSGTGTLATFTFLAAGSGTSSLTFSNVQVTDTQGQVQTPVTTAGGSVAVAVLVGQVTLQSHATAAGYPLRVWFFPPLGVTPLYTRTLALDANGVFTIYDVPVATYDVRVKGNHSLSNQRAGVILPSGSAPVRAA
ncbi:MAG: hypothetical protein FJ026_18445, partial [Chloroflexi bacterium]|nr:hypothetical protein [Chloroflexota bacterium]